MGTGYLKVNVHTGSDTLPVYPAMITVKDTSGKVISQTNTNSNGTSETLSLNAPDISKTLTPQPLHTAYDSYDVEIKADGFYPFVMRGVKIFDKQTALLPINLLPLVDDPSMSDIVDEITIPDTPLETDTARAEAPISPRAAKVLKNVIIPDYVTVHLAGPNTDARNVKVPFIDYIKNVASNEIYSTWPEAALEANILAEISFVLNRIYTEWYPSRGKNFDITSSTAYDQNYVESSPIYESISNVVDRVFNQYIRRKGNKEPYFTQFCNGTTVTCDGLSQWGTVPLAEQGYTPMQILKNYYPSDIERVESQNFASIDGSYPGSPLSLGSSGESVKDLQRYLNRIRVNFPLIPEIKSVDGVFGTQTADAVKAFQQINGLTPDGLVGRATWNKISQIYSGVKKLGELDSEGERVGIGTTPPSTELSQGMKGRDVLELQYILDYISAFHPSIPSVLQNSNFDASTKTAVNEFQRLFGLPVTGAVNSATWKKLYEVYKGIANNVPIPSDTSPTYPGAALRVGSKGPDVIVMQQYLNQLADRYPSIPKVTEDGSFGPATQNAVLQFQKLFGLSQDGVIGANTWNKIVQTYNNNSSGGGVSYPGTALRTGSRGSNVSLMQQYLNSISDRYPSIPKLTVDGVFGSGTQNAVLQFQKLFGLSQDGVIGANTWNKIVEVYNGSSSGGTTPAYPGSALGIGSRGSSVSTIQQYLNTLSAKYPSIPKLTVDGVYGNGTAAAVKAFQQIFGLTADGLVGPTTWNAIMNAYSGNRSLQSAQVPTSLYPERGIGAASPMGGMLLGTIMLNSFMNSGRRRF